MLGLAHRVLELLFKKGEHLNLPPPAGARMNGLAYGTHTQGGLQSIHGLHAASKSLVYTWLNACGSTVLMPSTLYRVSYPPLLPPKTKQLTVFGFGQVPSISHSQACCLTPSSSQCLGGSWCQ